MPTSEETAGRYLSWLLATMSLGASLIHFAVAGEHFAMTWWHGAFFAVGAFIQLAWAVLIALRPGRGLLASGMALNAAFIAAWVVSRTTGVPFGPDAGQAEPAALADTLATGLEAVVVVVAGVVLARPRLAFHHVPARLGLSGVAALGAGVFALSTLALTPAFAAGHRHDQDGAAAPANGTMDHGTGDHQGGTGHGDHQQTVIRADGTSACERWGGASGNVAHGHRGPVTDVPMDAADHRQFQSQVARSDAALARYPTVAAAKAGGYRQVSGYVPCSGAHFVRDDLLATGFDPAEPEAILYSGTEDAAFVVGLSYLVTSDREPDGFVGGTDRWHVHTTLCFSPEGGVLGPGNATDEECAARGGTNQQLGSLWMLHMWNVPGWESRWGLFSGEHPDLGGDLERLETL
jgi:hypothetical protein